MSITVENTKIAKILTSEMVKYKISLTDTLLSLEIGQPYIIKVDTLKASVIRRGIYVLRQKGYQFEVTEKGRIDDVVVIRKK